MIFVRDNTYTFLYMLSQTGGGESIRVYRDLPKN